MPTTRHVRRLPGVTTAFAPRPRIPTYIPTSFVQPRAAMADRTAIVRMAEDMREGAYREGGVTEHDLQVIGWLPAQIKRFGERARELAQRRACFS